MTEHTMNFETGSDRVNQMLDDIKSVGSKNQKIEMLSECLAEADFMYAIQMALDPRIRFGIAKKTWDLVKKDAAGDGDGEFIEDTLALLADLASRRLSGNDAKLALHNEVSRLSDDSVRLLERILLKKPDAGFTESSVNKACPGTLWTFDCMLAHKFEEKRVKNWPVATEPKIDGVRCLAFVDLKNRAVGFFSRSGQEYTAYGHMETPLLSYFDDRADNIEGFVIDGEMDSGMFNETVSQARKKDVDATDAVFRIFDILTIKGWNDGANVEYSSRRRVLTRLFGTPEAPKSKMFQVVESRLAYNVSDIMAHNDEVTAAGGEGVIVKPLDHKYERKRSHSWMKIKGYETFDIVITGFFEGDGKYKGMLGGYLCDFGGVEVRVGGGITDADRTYVWENQGEFKGRMIEVGSHEVTPDGSLRHPRFVRFRDDKAIAAE